jgi:hypothetical protein
VHPTKKEKGENMKDGQRNDEKKRIRQYEEKEREMMKEEGKENGREKLRRR